MKQQNSNQKLMKTGELLLENGLITRDQLNVALEVNKEKNKKVGEILVDMGFVTDEDIAKILSIQLGIPFIDFSFAVVEPAAIQLIPEKLCQKHALIPISIEKNVIKAAFTDPLDIVAIDELRFVSGRSVQPAVSTSSQIKEALAHHYNLKASLQDLVETVNVHMPLEVIYTETDEVDIAELLKRSEATPVITMVNGIVTGAIQNNASDIHLEPQKNCLKIRERVDGLLRDVVVFPKWVQGLVTSRIKIMAKMDIAEKRIPQDGKITVRCQGSNMDLRVSTLPTQYGENVVIRILNAQSAIVNLDKCGLSQNNFERVLSMIEKPQGIVLVAGPTGSGKTSTLYSMINHIKSDTINIVSLEDPVEYDFSWVSQVSINEKVGLSFPFTLRSVLRQDPDVIMVGEIRDQETAFIAAQASITGHLVLSSIHTNNAGATIARLKNMGLPPHLIVSSLNGIISQRLVRLICPACKTAYKPSSEDFLKIGIKNQEIQNLTVYMGRGCKQCSNTGYQGRTGVFETMVVNKRIRELIISDASEDAITEEALSSGMTDIFQDAFEKVKEGLTTIEELNRVLMFKE